MIARTFLAAILWLTLLNVAPVASAPRVDANVVFGMHSGLALLMDVHYPEKPNGYGILFIWGSGWHAPLVYAAPQLKARGPFGPLTDAGYTVFIINHRAAPRFRYPAALEDAEPPELEAADCVAFASPTDLSAFRTAPGEMVAEIAAYDHQYAFTFACPISG